MRITSADNPLVRRWRRIAESPRACRDAGRTLAEGEHVIQSALSAGVPIVTVATRGTAGGAGAALLGRLRAAAPQSKFVELAPALYDAFAPVEHGAGVLAEIAIPPADAALRADEDTVFLDAVQDPGNVGTVLRTAAAAGVRQVVAGPGSASLWSPKVLRAGMGAHFALRLAERRPVADVARGFAGDVIAADIDGEDLYGSDWGRAPTLWLFGSEGQGLGAEARTTAARRLRIPLAPAVESLNVGAAAAVCLFEQVRRRRGYM
jgi:TrmH family RNA methyltransferase